ncbi:2-amino-4-hydroxy-6-hydroxymethyldihydropteridine diphosphokinase [Prevotella sp. oral taxon 299]|uniref:2-amino-4-hydroxy-6- hydroxymethyldihydropteridine diphosphokinase n=1 Tax=Prevotella sp. oral taxon 299 TaxID=652716 RepID=UPI0001C408B4|nr:2-amino-4-hydroxy-6-hydroxymethyldihydropteridine diphosphokinase [Prevotella sp. oral taxon 299]EFC71390.1 2-amino-4-hydroxy-6-hydroxymethyldihydropteridine pyrophosphokinase [Prevotella sp. oral taxon 299 str. F0039]
MLHIVYLGLGSNIGARHEMIEKAIKLIAEQVGDVVLQSALYETEPWGFNSKNLFINGAIACQTALSPLEVLQKTQEIEKQLGRTHKTKNGEYEDRVIDIDILLYDDLHLTHSQVVIPHPHIANRTFVYQPLCDILSKSILERIIGQEIPYNKKEAQ